MNLINTSDDICLIIISLLENKDISALGSLCKNKLLYFSKKKYKLMISNMNYYLENGFMELIQKKQITKFRNINTIEHLILINNFTKPTHLTMDKNFNQVIELPQTLIYLRCKKEFKFINNSNINVVYF